MGNGFHKDLASATSTYLKKAMPDSNVMFRTKYIMFLKQHQTLQNVEPSRAATLVVPIAVYCIRKPKYVIKQADMWKYWSASSKSLSASKTK